MRLFTPRLWAFVAAIAIGGTFGACAREQSPARDPYAHYLERRARYLHGIDSTLTRGEQAALSADSAAVRDLSDQLRHLVAPLALDQLIDSGTINLGTFISGNVDTDLPDGILYRRETDQRLFVTDSTLFHAWIIERLGKTAPVPLDSALRSADVDPFAFYDEAALIPYAELPVQSSRGGFVLAWLVNHAQDNCEECTPSRLLVRVRSGARIVFAEAPASDTIAVPTACRQLFRHPPASSPPNTDAFPLLLRCYADSLATHPKRASLTRSAQALVDLLEREASAPSRR